MIQGAISCDQPDPLRLLLVLAEVPGGVEELLGHDRWAQARAGERNRLAGLVAAAALEVRAHVGDPEHADLVADDMADPEVLAERDEPHVAPQMSAAESAYTFAVAASPATSRFSPRSASGSPLEVP